MNRFYFSIEWQQLFAPLSNEDAGLVIKAILDYAESRSLPTHLSPSAMYAFSVMRASVDKDANTSILRALGGRKGGAPRGNKNASVHVAQKDLLTTPPPDSRPHNLPLLNRYALEWHFSVAGYLSLLQQTNYAECGTPFFIKLMSIINDPTVRDKRRCLARWCSDVLNIKIL